MYSVQLYSYFRSSASYRVRIALHHKKVAFEYMPIHLLNDGGEQLKDKYKKINPMAQVPSIVHEGKTIAQSMAIFQYLEDQWPTPALFPQTPFEKAKVIEICEAFNSGIQPLHNLSVLNFLGNEMGLGEAGKQKWGKHFVELGLSKMETLLQETAGTYCLGGTLTAADMFLVPQLFGGRRFGVDTAVYPTISRIEQACMKLDAFKKAQPENQPDFQK